MPTNERSTISQRIEKCCVFFCYFLWFYIFFTLIFSIFLNFRRKNFLPPQMQRWWKNFSTLFVFLARPFWVIWCFNLKVCFGVLCLRGKTFLPKVRSNKAEIFFCLVCLPCVVLSLCVLLIYTQCCLWLILIFCCFKWKYFSAILCFKRGRKHFPPHLPSISCLPCPFLSSLPYPFHFFHSSPV